MNQLDSFSIAFGNSSGQTSKVLLEEHRSRIQIANLRATRLEPPKIKTKANDALTLGVLRDCVAKKRDRHVLEELLKVDLDCNPDEIEENCKSIENKMANDLAVLGAMMEQTNTDKFLEQTKASPADAQKYLDKYPNLNEAVKAYKSHQEIINKFINQHKCDRETAVGFLEANDYNSAILQ